MKPITISGVATLFCILVPVTAMSGQAASVLVQVPNPNSNFSFLCPNGRDYDKNYLIRIIEMGRQIMRNSRIQSYNPSHFNDIQYNINGDQWCYPLTEENGTKDFVVFNSHDQIAGVVTRTDLTSGREDYRPCTIL
ncbi:BgTH12-06066 [Blumeria graminis f. sp. triticale]|uniref:Bgt-50462 n=2 Tax=Blumeria graminis TaxID=34373 RepID=A0A9X9MLZ2_BLUGR|nr:BgTH12-06066 [Blumeria graminis f. sp. triticale]VDB91151.1 Bgt-50462 [Blumeria graminis f. sp. tritici]